MDLNTKEIILLYSLLLDFDSDCAEMLNQPDTTAQERKEIKEDRQTAKRLANKFLNLSKAQGLDLAALLQQADL